MVYNGKQQGPKLTYNGKVLTEGTDYKWMPGGDSGSCINAGSYDILLFGRGQFAGAIRATYSIKAKKITPAVTLSRSSYTYNGKVTILKGLKKGIYKVKMKVRAAGNANYKKSARKTVSFKIKVK